MDPVLSAKAQLIIDAGFDVPAIFKAVLRGDTSLLDFNEIRDFVYLPREYRDERTKSGDIYKRGYLLIATARGVVIVQEGTGEELDIELGGFRVRYVPYSKIVAIEIDSVLMQAELSIYSGSGEEVKISIDFNRKQFYKEVSNFVNVIRRSI